MPTEYHGATLEMQAASTIAGTSVLRVEPRRVFLAISASGLLSVLTGCAHVRVTNVISPNLVAFTPAKIVVFVDPASASQSEPVVAAREAADTLQSIIIEQLSRAGIRSSPYALGTARLDGALLSVSIMLDPDGAANRTGTRPGCVKLKTIVNLQNENASGPSLLTAFNTSTDCGRESANHTATAIVGRLEHYYLSAGWDLPQA
jgi:hypothetical protein